MDDQKSAAVSELTAHILRPLYMLFVSCDVTMKQQILQTATNLIRNMVNLSIKILLPFSFLENPPPRAGGRTVSDKLFLVIPFETVLMA